MAPGCQFDQITGQPPFFRGDFRGDFRWQTKLQSKCQFYRVAGVVTLQPFHINLITVR